MTNPKMNKLYASVYVFKNFDGFLKSLANA